MKNTFTVILFLISIQIFSSNCIMCAPSELTFLPEKKQISLNTMFIIEGYAMSQKTIDSFRNRRVYLENKKGETVELILLTIHKGQMDLKQAVFKLKKELKSNSTYFLKISNLTELEKMDFTNWNLETGKREPVYWQTTNKKQSDFLNTNIEIDFKKTEVIHYGCGPSANAIFKVKNKRENEIWFKTEVINLVTNEKNIYIIREWNNNLNVGHGMCSGEFTFNGKGKHKVRFTPMNTDGKMNKRTKWFTFKNPYMNQKGFGF